MGGSGASDIRTGRNRALGELERYYEGPIRGLQIAPEFYKMLGSDQLKNTPLGRSLSLQQQLLGEVSAGLGGRAFGQRAGGRGGAGVLPPDLTSSISNQLYSSLAQGGIEGSPAGALQAAMRFSGASEDIRHQRIADASAILGQIGGGSIMPSASQFAQMGANRASQAANLEMQSGEDIANAKAAQRGFYGQLLGTAASGALGFFGAPSGMGLAGLFGGLTGRSSSDFPGMFGGNAFAGQNVDPGYLMRLYGRQPNYSAYDRTPFEG